MQYLFFSKSVQNVSFDRTSLKKPASTAAVERNTGTRRPGAFCRLEAGIVGDLMHDRTTPSNALFCSRGRTADGEQTVLGSFMHGPPILVWAAKFVAGRDTAETVASEEQ
jgi:hypothetical protein